MSLWNFDTCCTYLKYTDIKSELVHVPYYFNNKVSLSCIGWSFWVKEMSMK